LRDSSTVVAAYWAAANERDWKTFASLLAEDVVYEAPQTGERVRGRDNYLRFNIEGFPGDWRLEVVQVVGEKNAAASWIEFTNADGTRQPGLCFFVLNGQARIVRITDYWPEPYEPPPSREHLVERY
jgi:predicted ester cyclase